MRLFIWFWLLFSAQASASTVIYTIHSIPPPHTDGVMVVYLDLPDQWLDQVFQLPDNPQQAEKAALAILNSPEWIRQQQQLVESYQGVIKAWQLNLQKYPAVVFDQRWVVYGTADVELARQYLPSTQQEGK